MVIVPFLRAAKATRRSCKSAVVKAAGRNLRTSKVDGDTEGSTKLVIPGITLANRRARVVHPRSEAGAAELLGCVPEAPRQQLFFLHKPLERTYRSL